MSTHLTVHEHNFGSSLMRYRRTRHPAMLSATLQGFLPSKLEPLGFSPDGQLRVAS